MLAEPLRGRDIRLVKRSVGMPQPDDVAVAESDLRPRADHELLVRNRWFRVSISTRLMMSEGAEAVKGIPFPALRIGDTLADAAIGEVVAASDDGDLKPGDLVLHPLGWREFAVVDRSLCKAIRKEDPNPAAYLGHGWTAYAALTRGIQVRASDIVFVSSGAGAIGSMAGQIARRLGAGRVIGSTGSPDKADWMKRELGYDDVIVRGQGSIRDQLSRAAPRGLDVFVDIVGGEQLEVSVSMAREGARFVLLGALAAELAEKKSTKYAPVEIDSFALIIKGVTLRGYSADEDSEVFSEWIDRLDDPAWKDIALPATIVEGLEAAPQALRDACLGHGRGPTIVKL